MERRRFNEVFDSARLRAHWPDRKGRGLVLMSIVWLLIGTSVQEQPPVNGAFHQYIPTWVAATGWLAAASIAFVAAWVKHLRPWAMALLTVMPGIRLMSYITAWVVSLVPGGAPGYPRGWIAAITQVVMIAFVFYVAADSNDTTVDDLATVLQDTEGPSGDE